MRPAPCRWAGATLWVGLLSLSDCTWEAQRTDFGRTTFGAGGHGIAPATAHHDAAGAVGQARPSTAAERAATEVQGPGSAASVRAGETPTPTLQAGPEAGPEADQNGWRVLAPAQRSEAPPAQLGRACRFTGGHWLAAWATCLCPRGTSVLAARGCVALASPRPLAPNAPEQPSAWTPSATRHLGHDGAGAELWPAWEADTLPCNTWHIGAADATGRAAHEALRERRWPNAPNAPWELGGSPTLPVDYLDAAALRRWWPQLNPDTWMPPSQVHAAWAPWAPAPASPQRARRGCRQMARRLGRADGELARLLATLQGAELNDGDAARRAARLGARLAGACAAVDRRPPGADGSRRRPRGLRQPAPTLALLHRRGGPPAWRQEHVLLAPDQTQGPAQLRWQVLGVGPAVLQRRLDWWHASGEAEPLRLVTCYDAGGRTVAWAVGVTPRDGQWRWIWQRPTGANNGRPTRAAPRPSVRRG